jgi:Protein of unknown function (DUF1759)
VEVPRKRTKLIRTRGNYIGQLTTLVNNYGEGDASNLQYCEFVITSVEQIAIKFEEVQLKLLEIIEEEDIPVQRDIQAVFDTKVQELKLKFGKLLRERKLEDESFSRRNSMVSAEASVGEQKTTASERDERGNVATRLPKLQIKRFNGEFINWPSFRDQFTAQVHNNMRLSDVDKLQYLMSYMTGEAENVLKGYQLTDEQYEAAWKSLERRYNHVGVLLHEFMSSLYVMPLAKREDHSHLAGLVDKVEAYQRAISSMPIEAQSADAWISFLIMERLPQETLNLWKQKRSKDIAPLRELLEFLEKRSVEVVHTKQTMTVGTTVGMLVKGERTNEAMSKSSGESRTMPVTVVFQCTLCNKAHELASCKDFKIKSVSDRREFVKNVGLC